MTTKGEILEFLARNKEYFREKFGITKIGLFGSYAKDEQAEDSDIDLIVEFELNTPNLFDVKNELKDYIKSMFQVNVDIARE
jgi:predicted nucleotidyltransferase